jgi:hypothetical protein
LVQCDPARWQARLERRTHTVGLAYAQKMISLYEPPTIPYRTLDDSAEGAEELLRQLVELLDQLA